MPRTTLTAFSSLPPPVPDSTLALGSAAWAAFARPSAAVKAASDAITVFMEKSSLAGLRPHLAEELRPAGAAASSRPSRLYGAGYPSYLAGVLRGVAVREPQRSARQHTWLSSHGARGGSTRPAWRDRRCSLRPGRRSARRRIRRAPRQIMHSLWISAFVVAI